MLCCSFAVPFWIGIGSSARAQNFDKVGKKDMLKINGGLNVNSIFLKTNNNNSTRAPFSWYLNGNVTVSILDWSLPFNYSYSNQHGTYTQPFNQFGVTPTYKWVKAYAGWSSMNFSSYTLSGYTFLGGGLELSPKNFRMAVMYGRLKKAVEYDAINESDQNMSYKRMGMGAKIGYEKSGYAIHAIWFQANDDPHSISYIPLATQIQPQQNTVVSVVGKAPITKLFNLSAEYALSGFTRNVFADKITDNSKSRLPFIFERRTTSQFFTAFKSSINYNYKIVSCGSK